MECWVLVVGWLGLELKLWNVGRLVFASREILLKLGTDSRTASKKYVWLEE
jgi:hypothetical protein